MLSIVSAGDLGGRAIVLIFQSKYKVNAKSKPRVFVRLLVEVEELKKEMSANSTTLSWNIECLDDKDIHGVIKRADMESRRAHLFQKVASVLKHCLEQSRLSLESRKIVLLKLLDELISCNAY